MIDQDSQMAEGDHDEREQADPKEQEAKDEEMAPEDASDEGERDSDEKEEEQDIGLNNESVPAEPDENFSEESKSEAGQDMSD